MKICDLCIRETFDELAALSDEFRSHDLAEICQTCKTKVNKAIDEVWDRTNAYSRHERAKAFQRVVEEIKGKPYRPKTVFGRIWKEVLKF
jgi:quinol monooxygenase YgiN